MRSRHRQVLAAGSRTGKCHPPFVPVKPGKYLLQRCPNCGEGVPIEAQIHGASVYTLEVTSQFGKK